MIQPLRLGFVITSMPVGGAETLLANLVCRAKTYSADSIICCLKEPGPLGEALATEMPVYSQLIRHKYDLGVIRKLRRIFCDNQLDAVITVGAGDKMFWGRLAARWSRVPVVLSALHSTGWPDGVGRLNRLLTPITDGFIAVAKSHGQFLTEQERFPSNKVFVIPNGIDVDRFQFSSEQRNAWRTRLGIPLDAPVVGIVAALRPEKNHLMFLEAAQLVARKLPQAHFVIAGDGPMRADIENWSSELGIAENTHLLGNVSDTPSMLSMLDCFSLTSKNEASPVSILEALACQCPVVATNVGSVSETVIDEETGFLIPEGNASAAASSWLQVLQSPELAKQLGQNGRRLVCERQSLDSMTCGYIDLVRKLLDAKSSASRSALKQQVRELHADSDRLVPSPIASSKATLR